MPTGGKNGDTQPGNNGQERPVVFQKYFKSGGRTYASQIKIASNGKRYLVLTEGIRDPETREVKKHIIRVFESDLKEFFAMMQETVLFLRSTKDPGNTVAGMIATKPAAPPQATPVAASRPPVATPALGPARAPVANATRPAVAKAPANANGNGRPVPSAPSARSAKPVAAAGNGKSVKPGYRPNGRGR